MQRRPLRDELRDAFDTMSEPAHPALASRIHEEIRGQPAPGAGIPRLAAVIAAVVAVVAVAGLVLIGRHALPGQTVPAGQGGLPSPVATTPAGPPPGSPGPAIAASPGATSPAPSAGTTPPGFTCATQTGRAAQPPGSTGPVPVTDVRAAAQSGVDRFVIQFSGPVPQYEVKPQASTTFTQDPSGFRVTLDGSAGLQVTVHGAQSYGSYSGSTDLRPRLSVLREARQVGDFEGVLTWGLGLSHASCFRAYVLTGPSRLVIDVQQ